MSNQDSFERGYSRYCEVVQGSGVQTALNSSIVNHQGTQYVGNIKEAIKDLEKAINKLKNNGNPNARGFAAEKWHAGTFNIDAAKKDKKVRARTTDTNDLGSVDIKTTDGQDYSSKYGDTSVKSADGQSIDVEKKIKKLYGNYKKRTKRNGKNPIGYEEYRRKQLRKLGLDENMSQKESESMALYKGQKRTVPKGQKEQAQDYLRKGAEKDRKTPGKEHFADTKEETADEMTETVTSKDGTVSSKELSVDDADNIADEGRKGEFEAKNHGLSTEFVEYKYILKKSCKIGLRTAIASAAISMLPHIVQMLVDEGYSFDDFKNMCETGATSGVEGFLQGSISAGMSISCQLGKFGEVLKNANPETMAYASAAITAIAIHTLKNTYLVSMGKMQSRELVNNLISESFISLGGYAGGILGQMIPIPFIGYFIGSAIGSMFASFVYRQGYSAILGLCVENGYTLWNLVKQDYTLPNEVLKEIGFDIVEFEKVSLERVEFEKVELEKVNFETVTPESLSVVFLRRGIIGINAVGYV